MTKPNRTFRLGKLVATANAVNAIPAICIYDALERHEKGDWGDLCPEDRLTNEKALEADGRLLSVYASYGCPTFWIITEADRSSTTVLLPSDY